MMAQNEQTTEEHSMLEQQSPGRLDHPALCVVWTVWRRGIVVSGVCRMNEVNARRARLVPGWVTVFGRVYRLGM